MIATLALWKGVVAGVVFATLFVGERIFRADARAVTSSRLVKNLTLWTLVVLASPFIVAPLTGLGANQLVWTRPGWASAGAGVIAIIFLVVDIIVLDIWTYWLHRAYHHIPFLWRFHQVHHRDAFLDTTSAFRFHLGEVLISAVLRLLVIALFAIPLVHVIIFETLLLCSAVFHHSNLRLPPSLEQAMSKIIVTPSIHWVHHHAQRAHTDSNYAAILSCWDDVFKSRADFRRKPGMKIGVEGLEEKGLLALLLMPFGTKS